MHQAEVEIVAASIGDHDIPLTTYKLRYWRGIHSELMTHRVFSRNAGSSRARPSAAIIKQVREDPWGPLHWGQNEPGMQASEQIQHVEDAKERWRWAAEQAADAAEGMRSIGLHKQVVNRVLEPFTFIDVVLTATDFANWFALRDHKDADPTIRDLAVQMKEAEAKCHRTLMSPGMWHLPFIRPEDIKNVINKITAGGVLRKLPTDAEINEYLLKISTARCARTSYKAFDGLVSSIADDIALFEKLVVAQPLHASPAEHQATPDEWEYDELSRTADWKAPGLHGNFLGWIQHRKLLPNECVWG